MQPMTQTPPRRLVIVDVPPFIEEWRKRTGADQRDEVWEGVVHMGPSPTEDHHEAVFQLEVWLRRYWAKSCGGRVLGDCNVAPTGLRKWTDNYRVPDLFLIKPERLAYSRRTHFAGGPNVIVEIRSPGDESYEKLPFYFEIGVEEAWVIDRDSKAPEIFVRGVKAFRKAKANRAGWLVSKVTGVAMRAAKGKLALRLRDEPASDAMVPED